MAASNERQNSKPNGSDDGMAQLRDLLRKIPRTSPPPKLTSPAEDEDECSLCNGAGWVKGELERVTDDKINQPMFRCRCNPERPKGIPLSRLNNTFANFDLAKNPEMEPALERCQMVARGEAWDALLHGGYGTGKTHLAIAALNEFGRGHFWKAPDMLDWIRQRAYGDGVGAEEALSGFREGTGLLVVDDLGTEKNTDWAGEQMYRILDSRYDMGLPTIITSNYDFGRLDGRIKSRFSGGLVVCEGVDLRSRQRAETA